MKRWLIRIGAVLGATLVLLLLAGALTIAGVIQSPSLELVTARVVSKNFGEVVPGVYRMGQPRPTSLPWLFDMYGFRTVLHLAWDGTELDRTEAALSESRGAVHHHVSWRPEGPPDPAEVERILELVRTAPRPLLIHCRGGKDRTGGLAALIELEAGRSLDDIRAEWKRYGLPSTGWQQAITSAAD